MTESDQQSVDIEAALRRGWDQFCIDLGKLIIHVSEMKYGNVPYFVLVLGRDKDQIHVVANHPDNDSVKRTLGLAHEKGLDHQEKISVSGGI